MNAPSRPQVPPWVIALAAAVPAILVLDVLQFGWSGGEVRGMDKLVLGAAGALLLLVLLLRGRRGGIAVSILVTTGLILLLELVISLPALRQERAFPWYLHPPNTQVQLTPKDLVGVSEQATFSINSRGLRGEELAPNHTYRILAVGGSTTECTYLDDALTWPAQLQRELREQHPGVWVGNAGQSGRNSYHHITLLESLPEARDADAWVVLVGLNDLGHHLRGTYDELAARSWELTYPHRRAQLWGRWRRPFIRNFSWFHAYEKIKASRTGADGGVAIQDAEGRWLKERRARFLASELADVAPPIEEPLKVYTANLQRIIELAKQREKRLVFLTQPVLWDLEMTDEAKSLCMGSAPTTDGRLYTLERMAAAMAVFNQRLRDVAAREGIEVVDLAAELPRSSDVFYDDCHFNESGARRIAEQVAPTLLSGMPSL